MKFHQNKGFFSFVHLKVRQIMWKRDRQTRIYSYTHIHSKKVKYSHPRLRLRALGLELVPVSWQSARRWLRHKPGSRLPLLSTRPAVTFSATEITLLFGRWKSKVGEVRGAVGKMTSEHSPSSKFATTPLFMVKVGIVSTDYTAYNWPVNHWQNHTRC